MHHHVRLGSSIYNNVDMKDVLAALAEKFPRRTDMQGPKVHGLGEPAGNADDKITVRTLDLRENSMTPCRPSARPSPNLIAEAHVGSGVKHFEFIESINKLQECSICRRRRCAMHTDA